MQSICVYCGSNPGRNPAYLDAARELAAMMAGAGWRLVYGGAAIGSMGAVADAVLAAGGDVMGVIPRHLVNQEVAHPGLTELVVVESMHERKRRMADEADGFVALPGGLGTLEELAEVLTWAQLRLHNKPVVLLNVDGYYDSLLAFLDQAVKEQFVHPAHRALVIDRSDPAEAMQALRTWVPGPPPASKWIEKSATGSWR